VEEAWLARWGRLTRQAMGWSLVGESGSPRIEGRGVVYTVGDALAGVSASRPMYRGEGGSPSSSPRRVVRRKTRAFLVV
jgi:hypothetical protein